MTNDMETWSTCPLATLLQATPATKGKVSKKEPLSKLRRGPTAASPAPDHLPHRQTRTPSSSSSSWQHRSSHDVVVGRDAVDVDRSTLSSLQHKHTPPQPATGTITSGGGGRAALSYDSVLGTNTSLLPARGQLPLERFRAQILHPDQQQPQHQQQQHSERSSCVDPDEADYHPHHHHRQHQRTPPQAQEDEQQSGAQRSANASPSTEGGSRNAMTQRSGGLSATTVSHNGTQSTGNGGVRKHTRAKGARDAALLARTLQVMRRLTTREELLRHVEELRSSAQSAEKPHHGNASSSRQVVVEGTTTPAVSPATEKDDGAGIMIKVQRLVRSQTAAWKEERKNAKQKRKFAEEDDKCDNQSCHDRDSTSHALDGEEKVEDVCLQQSAIEARNEIEETLGGDDANNQEATVADEPSQTHSEVQRSSADPPEDAQDEPVNETNHRHHSTSRSVVVLTESGDGSFTTEMNENCEEEEALSSFEIDLSSVALRMEHVPFVIPFLTQHCRSQRLPLRVLNLTSLQTPLSYAKQVAALLMSLLRSLPSCVVLHLSESCRLQSLHYEQLTDALEHNVSLLEQKEERKRDRKQRQTQRSEMAKRDDELDFYFWENSLRCGLMQSQDVARKELGSLFRSGIIAARAAQAQFMKRRDAEERDALFVESCATLRKMYDDGMQALRYRQMQFTVQWEQRTRQLIVVWMSQEMDAIHVAKRKHYMVVAERLRLVATLRRDTVLSLMNQERTARCRIRAQFLGIQLAMLIRRYCILKKHSQQVQAAMGGTPRQALRQRAQFLSYCRVQTPWYVFHPVLDVSLSASQRQMQRLCALQNASVSNSSSQSTFAAGAPTTSPTNQARQRAAGGGKGTTTSRQVSPKSGDGVAVFAVPDNAADSPFIKYDDDNDRGEEGDDDDMLFPTDGSLTTSRSIGNIMKQVLSQNMDVRMRQAQNQLQQNAKRGEEALLLEQSTAVVSMSSSATRAKLEEFGLAMPNDEPTDQGSGSRSASFVGQRRRSETAVAAPDCDDPNNNAQITPLAEPLLMNHVQASEWLSSGGGAESEVIGSPTGPQDDAVMTDHTNEKGEEDEEEVKESSQEAVSQSDDDKNVAEREHPAATTDAHEMTKTENETLADEEPPAPLP